MTDRERIEQLERRVDFLDRAVSQMLCRSRLADFMLHKEEPRCPLTRKEPSTEMTYAHVYDSAKAAASAFRVFLKDNDSHIALITKLGQIGKVTLKNGDEHWFMRIDQYDRWKQGKVYMHHGVLYHSGFPIGIVESRCEK